MTDLNKIVGTWPGSKDDGFEKDIQELRHGYPTWQPLETAPRDGQRFLVSVFYAMDRIHSVIIISYDKFSDKFLTDDFHWINTDYINGWMPLPEPPTEVVK